jgi:hypothetical protein
MTGNNNFDSFCSVISFGLNVSINTNISGNGASSTISMSQSGVTGPVNKNVTAANQNENHNSLDSGKFEK